MDSGQIPPTHMASPAQVVSGGMPMVQQVQVAPPRRKDVAGLVKTIVIIILSLVHLLWMKVSI